jgi:hypothetical protein
VDAREDPKDNHHVQSYHPEIIVWRLLEALAHILVGVKCPGFHFAIDLLARVGDDKLEFDV